jgi:hypothetical protein
MMFFFDEPGQLLGTGPDPAFFARKGKGEMGLGDGVYYLY